MLLTGEAPVFTQVIRGDAGAASALPPSLGDDQELREVADGQRAGRSSPTA